MANLSTVSEATEPKIKEVRKLPLIRQNSSPCDFQKARAPRKLKPKPEEVTSSDESRYSKQTSLANKLPEIMAKFKAQLSAKDFTLKLRKSVERHKREERPWVKGNEISPFFHVWQTSDDHLKDKKLQARTVRRSRSMPRNFKFSDISSEKAIVPEITTSFGIVRECCSRPKLRVKLFPET